MIPNLNSGHIAVLLQSVDVSNPEVVKLLEAQKKQFWKRRGIESTKSAIRRKLEGWFDKYMPFDQPGIDIGAGIDPVHPAFRKYDQMFGDGDAQYMKDVADESYQTVYTSHILEHVHDPGVAVENWYRICKTGGHLIICVPHRELYEKRRTLPSQWNGDHKTFWLPERHELPLTRGLRQTIQEAIPFAKIISVRELKEGWVSNGPNAHSDGEYSIEAVIQKMPNRKLYL